VATEGYSGAHLYELAHFTRTLAAEETLTLPVALKRALAKIAEQRELVQGLAGYRYTPAPAVRALLTATDPSRFRSWTRCRAEGVPAVMTADLVPGADAIEAAVRRVLGLPGTVERQGAVLNRKNREAIEQAMTLLQGVLRAAEKAPKDDDEDDEDEDEMMDDAPMGRAVRAEFDALHAQMDKLNTLAERRRQESAAAAILRDVGSRARERAARLRTETQPTPVPTPRPARS